MSTLVKKYVRYLENRKTNKDTGEIWKVEDVPPYWRDDVIDQIEKDGYTILEDGTVSKEVPNE